MAESENKGVPSDRHLQSHLEYCVGTHFHYAHMSEQRWGWECTGYFAQCRNPLSFLVTSPWSIMFVHVSIKMHQNSYIQGLFTPSGSYLNNYLHSLYATRSRIGTQRPGAVRNYHYVTQPPRHFWLSLWTIGSSDGKIARFPNSAILSMDGAVTSVVGCGWFNGPIITLVLLAGSGVAVPLMINFSFVWTAETALCLLRAKVDHTTFSPSTFVAFCAPVSPSFGVSVSRSLCFRSRDSACVVSLRLYLSPVRRLSGSVSL